MKQLLTTGIVLTRTDYAEADRILTLLTPDQGKLRLIARGVRKIKSRAAGGIELFSVSEIGFMQGRGELGTLISAHLLKHYGKIIQDIDRVQLGYELIRMLHRATEDQLEEEYFELLQQGFEALNDHSISTTLISAWFQAQLLSVGGHTPNLVTDVTGIGLIQTDCYIFDYDSVAFVKNEEGQYDASHIKVLRILFGSHRPSVIAQIKGVEPLLEDIIQLVTVMRKTYVRS
jgi:DNA repair protein RecO (recombination protein O)